MITSLRQFVSKAQQLDNEGRIGDMFDVFESDTIETVRDQVYSLADEISPEPFRSAMINIGFPSY